ncbi:MAG: SOS response-associated peptidase [Deltaproteobacteria bacterium]|nr:SOS response-associated peptidase [Deltaproteobacteria bacterium]
MCGRFILISDLSDLCGSFNIDDVEFLPEENYNITPGSTVSAVIAHQGRRVLRACLWGLVPHWSKKISGRVGLINARVETIHEKPSFRSSFKKKRCLIPADGYYEWRLGKTKKTPFFIRSASKEPLGLAGLYDVWSDGEGRERWTCAIVTMEADSRMQPIHNRMPVIVAPEDRRLWLDPETESEVLRGMLMSRENEELEAYPVSTLVNSPRNNDPRLIERASH